MARKFTKYPSNYVMASALDRDYYIWEGAQSVANDAYGKWYIVEGSPDSRNFYFYLVCKRPDGTVEALRERRIPRDDYTTEKAHALMAELADDYYDFR